MDRLLQDRKRKVIAGVFALQFLVPLIALVGSPAPTRFGFQMYSGEGELTGYYLTDTGNHEDLDVNELLAAGRPEIDWIKRLPGDYLCDSNPDAAAVVLKQGGRSVSHTC